jgi:hypothetical protein
MFGTKHSSQAGASDRRIIHHAGRVRKTARTQSRPAWARRARDVRTRKDGNRALCHPTASLHSQWRGAPRATCPTVMLKILLVRPDLRWLGALGRAPQHDSSGQTQEDQFGRRLEREIPIAERNFQHAACGSAPARPGIARSNGWKVCVGGRFTVKLRASSSS